MTLEDFKIVKDMVADFDELYANQGLIAINPGYIHLDVPNFVTLASQAKVCDIEAGINFAKGMITLSMTVDGLRVITVITNEEE